MRSRASSFKWEYPLLSLRSSTSFLRLIPRLLVTSISPFIFPSITCFRRQFLRKMWPIQLAFHFFWDYSLPIPAAESGDTVLENLDPTVPIMYFITSCLCLTLGFLVLWLICVLRQMSPYAVSGRGKACLQCFFWIASCNMGVASCTFECCQPIKAAISLSAFYLAY